MFEKNIMAMLDYNKEAILIGEDEGYLQMVSKNEMSLIMDARISSH